MSLRPSESMEILGHPIHCIGDSHVCFFSGQERQGGGIPGQDDHLPWFRSYWVGPALAYNLCETGTTTQSREQLFEILRSDVPRGGCVLLCFGEIDCRSQLIRRSEESGRALTVVVGECVQRYASVFCEIKSVGYQPMEVVP